MWRGVSDTLGQRHVELEQRLVAPGILQCRAVDYTASGVDGTPRLDLARVFDDLDAHPG